EVAGERFLDFLAGRAWPLGEQRRGREEDARRAVPALGGAELGEGLLERVKPPALRHTLDRRDAGSLGLDREGQAREHRLAVDEHGAPPALAEPAALRAAREPAILTQPPH